MSKTYQCANCGARLDASKNEGAMRCEFCGTFTERDGVPHEKNDSSLTKKRARHEAAETRDSESAPESKKKKNKSDNFFLFYVGSIALLLAGTFGYAYFHAHRTVVGKPIIADVNGDGVEDIILQFDEEVRFGRGSLVGLIDGKTKKIVWTFASPKKTYSNPLPMALGDGYLILGMPNPVANILDVRTGALRHAIDLPDNPSGAYANGMTAWMDMNGKAVRIDASTGRATRMKDSSYIDPERPAWAPYDERQSCPRKTCRNNAPMAILDMKVHEVYVDGSNATSDEAVAVGQKENGTHLPMLAGISLSKKTTQWTRVISTSEAVTPQDPIIARGRVYFEYTDGRFRHDACASVSTGEIVWDVKSSENASRASNFVVAQNLYMTRGRELEIYDVNNGHLLTSWP